MKKNLLILLSIVTNLVVIGVVAFSILYAESHREHLNFVVSSVAFYYRYYKFHKILHLAINVVLFVLYRYFLAKSVCKSISNYKPNESKLWFWSTFSTGLMAVALYILQMIKDEYIKNKDKKPIKEIVLTVVLILVQFALNPLVWFAIGSHPW